MGGAQGKVSNAAKKSAAAQATLQKFEKDRKNDAKSYEEDFNKKITAELLRAGINDQLFPIGTGIQQQTEYASEFNVDLLAGVVTTALKSFEAATGDDGKATMETATSTEAIDSYVQLVESIAASLKSSSSSSSTFTFQMTKIGPGVFAFISAMSANLTDKQMFGSEAVSCATFVYTFARSLQDIKNTTGYQTAVANSTTEFLFKTQTLIVAAKAAQASIINFKEAQLENVTNLTSGRITVAAYGEMDDVYQSLIDKAMERQLAQFPAYTNVALLKHDLGEGDSTQLRTLKLKSDQLKRASPITFLKSGSGFSVDESSSSSADFKEGVDQAINKVLERAATGLKAIPTLEETLHSRPRPQAAGISGFSHRPAAAPDQGCAVSFSVSGASFSVSGSQFELSLKVDNGASVSAAPAFAPSSLRSMGKGLKLGTSDFMNLTFRGEVVGEYEDNTYGLDDIHIDRTATFKMPVADALDASNEMSFMRFALDEPYGIIHITTVSEVNLKRVKKAEFHVTFEDDSVQGTRAGNVRMFYEVHKHGGKWEAKRNSGHGGDNPPEELILKGVAKKIMEAFASVLTEKVNPNVN